MTYIYDVTSFATDVSKDAESNKKTGGYDTLKTLSSVEEAQVFGEQNAKRMQESLSTQHLRGFPGVRSKQDTITDIFGYNLRKRSLACPGISKQFKKL